MSHAARFPGAGIARLIHPLLKTAARVAAASALLALPAIGMAAPSDDGVKVIELVRRHAAAQATFDLPALQATTADNYVEISPAGEVDPREKMLGFYDPKNRQAAPAMEIDETTARVFGDSAVVLARLTYSVPGPDGKLRTVGSMRGGFVAHKTGDGWKLVSAQYTGIRPPRPDAPKAETSKN